MFGNAQNPVLLAFRRNQSRPSAAVQRIRPPQYASGSFELIAEIDPSQSVNQGILRTFTRGLDNTHSLGGGGGIGGVIALDDWELQESYYLGHDGRGNVSTIHDREDGTLTGGYEYLPFGERVRKSGNWRVNPFRFQSKWGLDFGPREGEHWPITLYDHNLRAYDPSLGRFGNRDPIGDAGGNNLYAYASNDPINRWDYLGLCTLYVVQIWDYYSNGQYTGTDIEYEIHCDGRAQQFSVAITEGSGGGGLGREPQKEEKEKDRDRKKRCDEIVSSLSKWGNLRATGVYDGNTWVDINNATRYMSSGKNIDNLAAAFGDSVAAEFTEILNAAMGLADPLAGYISSSGGYTLALEGGRRTDAAVSLVGTVSGGVQTADFLHKLYNGTSLLTPTASAGVRFAGWVGVAYTVGKVGYGTYTRYEPNPMLRVTTPATPAQQAESLKFLAEMTDPMMNSLSEAYRENNCQDFY